MLWLTTLAAGFVLATCVVLALHRDYHTSVLGNVGMGAIGIGAMVRVAIILEHGVHAEVTPLAAVVWIGLACFFGEVLLKFMRRLRVKGKPGWYERDATKIEAP
jgi:hypothetical protein